MSIFAINANEFTATVAVEVSQISADDIAARTAGKVKGKAAEIIADRENRIALYFAACDAEKALANGAKEAAFQLLSHIKTKAQGEEMRDTFKLLKYADYMRKNPTAEKKNAQTACNTAWSRAVSNANSHAVEAGVEWEFPSLLATDAESVAKREKRAAAAEQRRAEKKLKEARETVTQSGATIQDGEIHKVQAPPALVAMLEEMAQSDNGVEAFTTAYAAWKLSQSTESTDESGDVIDVEATVVPESAIIEQLEAPAKPKRTRKSRKAA